MGFFKRNWWKVLISLVLSLFAFSLYYKSLGYCDGVPYPLALCGVYRIWFDIDIIRQLIFALIADPKGVFETLFSSYGYEADPIAQGFTRAAFVGVFFFLIVVGAIYFLISLFISYLYKKRVRKTKRVY